MAAHALTPQQISDALYAQIPRALSQQMLGDYGIQASDEKAGLLTEEVLSLNLFWIQMAMEAHLTDLAKHIIYEIFLRRVKENCAVDYHLDPATQEQFFSGLSGRHEEYRRIAESGGEPIVIYTDRANTLESDGVVSPGETMQVVALFIDCVAVDSYGELLEDVDILEE